MKSKLTLRILFFALCTVLLCALGCAALADNSNFISSGGWFAYRDGYMYFVGKDWTSCKLNGGRETGLPDSVEFWRIADEPGAQKELVASLPAAYIGGLGLDPGYCPVPVDDAIYFAQQWPISKHRTDNLLARFDLLSGTVETIESFRNCVENSQIYVWLPYFVDGDQIYFMNNDKQGMVLDTQTNQLQPWSVQSTDGKISPTFKNQFEFGFIFDIQDGYVYYADVDPLAEAQLHPGKYCISRMPVSGGEREIIFPRSNDTSAEPFCFVQDQMLFVFDRDAFDCVDLASGTVVDHVVLDSNARIDNDYGATLNVADGKLYYLKADGLYVKTIGLDDETRLITGDTDQIRSLTLGENYYYFTQSDRRVFRVPRSARFFQEAEILLDEQFKDEESLFQTENGWQFFEYENCVMIEDYLGDETRAEVPAMIHGKPVVCVSLDPWGQEAPSLQELVIPEGVLRLGVIGNKNLTDLSLPSSLLVMDNDGYPTVFATADGCTIHYAGTRAEWQALEDNSWTDYSAWLYREVEGLRVLCSDGEWIEGEEISASAETPEMTQPDIESEPDDAMDGTPPIPAEEVQRLFDLLSQTPLIAASGAGAWEGRLNVSPDGSFIGYYYDEDAGDEVIYEVSFSGRFIPSGTEQWGDSVYGLWVEDLVTEQEPGTEAISEYGETILYGNAPIYDRDYLRLTLPNTDNDEIPEMVRDEIGGTYDEWEDYSRFITLTRDDGWGFFADPSLPPAPDLEPVPVAEEPPETDVPSVPSPYTGDGEVLVDDDVITIVNLGKEVRKTSWLVSGSYVEYKLSVTNKLDHDIWLCGGQVDNEYQYGSVDGSKIWHLYVESDELDPKIPAGGTVEVRVFPQGHGYGYRTLEEMVNVTVYIHAKLDVEGNSKRDYTLLMDQGKTYNRAPASGYTVHDATPYGFTFELPDDWEVYFPTNEFLRYANEYQEGYVWNWDYDMITLESPPTLSVIFDIAAINQDEIGQQIFSEVTQISETLIDGHHTYIYEYERSVEISYYIESDIGRIIYIDIPKYATTEERAILDHFLASIRFQSEGSQSDVSETPATEQPAAPETPAVEAPASTDLSTWTGYWMTRDDSLSEMLVTPNEDGTLHAEVFFFRTLNLHATLTPQADGSIRFETDYGALIGVLAKNGDGSLQLNFTGGYAYGDEEASEYNDYYARTFVYFPAAYEEMWYEKAPDQPGADGDWLGVWTVQNGDRESNLLIERDGGGFRAQINMNNGGSFSGELEKETDSVMTFYGDDFNCMLTLNRKLDRIVMDEIGADSDGVYDWLEAFPYAIVEYERYKLSVSAPQELIDSAENAPPLTTLPVQDAEPDNGRLLPIPGKPGYMQVPVDNVAATSYIVNKNDPTAYAPSRMIDGEETTSFQFSTKTTPLGQAYIYFEFASPVTLDELWMKNGFWKITDGKDQYTRNSRVKQMTIFVRYADSGNYRELKTTTLKDDKSRKDWKVIDLLGQTNVTGVCIRIDAIYTGSKYKTDVCISEIMFVQATGE